MKERLKLLKLISGLVTIVLIGFVSYIAITKHGISYQGVYSEHINEAVSKLSQQERYEKDFNFLYEEIKNNYINLKYKEELLKINWDELYDKYKKELENVQTEDDFYLLCNKFLYVLKDGHTNFQVLDADISMPNNSIKGLMRVRLIENKGIIVAAQPQLDILGKEIVSINGIGFLEIVDRMTEYFSPDYNEIAARSNIISLNRFLDYFYYFDNANSDELLIELKDIKGRKETIAIDTTRQYESIPMKSIHNINFGFRESNLPAYEILDGDIGYIKIPTFNGNRKEIVNKFDHIVKNLKQKNVRGAIIDIRYNKGGNQSYRDILGYLTDKPIDIVHYRMKKTKRFLEIYSLRHIYENIRSKSPDKPSEEGYTKWWTWTVKPNKEQFLVKIPMVVIGNEQIFSSADGFAKACLDYDLATVVSSIVPLSGHGLSTTIALPSKKYAVTYGFFEARGIDFSELENVIEKPDIESHQRLQDLHNEIDTQLEDAIKYINTY